LFLIFLLFTTIISNPVIENTNESIKKNWIDIEILFDVSYSMIAEDLPPNRLEVAKEVINNFLDKQLSNRIWIIVFSWKPFRSLPLNFDYKIIKNIVSKIDINILNQSIFDMQWTAIWDALIMWADNLIKAKTNTDNQNELKNRKKVIILLTDWEANRWINPILALKYVKENNIKVYTIWLWWDKKTTINMPDYYWNMMKVEIGWVDDKTLQKIADETWWKYFRANSKWVLDSVFKEINELEKTEIKVDIVKTNKEKNRELLYVLIMLLCLFFWVKKWKRIG
jgi:Ca-activated chloride channel family protein